MNLDWKFMLKLTLETTDTPGLTRLELKLAGNLWLGGGARVNQIFNQRVGGFDFKNKTKLQQHV